MITRDTVHVLSHPKAGRTWLRLMFSMFFQKYFNLSISKTQYLEVQQFPDIDERVPHIHFTHDRNAHLKPVEATRDKSMYADNKVIYLVRDPRDVIVSNYFQQNRREPVLKDAPVFPGTMSEYIRHPQFGIAHDIALMNVWAEQEVPPRVFMVVFYEDLTECTTDSLSSILQMLIPTLDIVVNRSLITQITHSCSFESMRFMEQNDVFNSGRLRPTDVNDPESYKVRRGVIGGYVDYLNIEDIEFVNKEMEQLDRRYGYEI